MPTITEQQRIELVEAFANIKELNKVLVDALETIMGESEDWFSREVAEETLIKYRKLQR